MEESYAMIKEFSTSKLSMIDSYRLKDRIKDASMKIAVAKRILVTEEPMWIKIVWVDNSVWKAPILFTNWALVYLYMLNIDAMEAESKKQSVDATKIWTLYYTFVYPGFLMSFENFIKRG